VSFPDLITSREAEARLAYPGLARRQARRVLAAGLAGPAMATRSAVLYQAEAVNDLTCWPVLTEAEVDVACPSGVFVARRDLDLMSPRAEVVQALREGWDLSPYTSAWIRAVCQQDGCLPFVATVGGFVALGAEITGVAQTADRQRRLDLRDAGEWFEMFRGARFPTGPGRDWVLRGSPCSSVSRSVGESPP
jgi:hypothetical protein